ncbi:MAG: DUF6483 family protein [Clostridiaceae bacterium]|nr:DUF6483 family protein [Clostridiaceae bacterium]
MLKTDYKKELENGLNEVIEEIKHSLIDGDKNKAYEALNKKLRSLVGIDMNTVEMVTIQDIIDIVGRDNQHNAERYVALGEILLLYGEVSEKFDDEMNKFSMYKKSLRAFYEAYMEEESLEEKYMNDAIKVVDYVSQYEVSLEDNQCIFKLYEVSNKLDRAEDILYDMIEESGKSKEMIKIGIDFYNRLKRFPEKKLIEGNLPIDEVNQGLKNLQK